MPYHRRMAEQRSGATQPARTPALILVGGMPASGKSSIAEQLAADLGIAWINKDGIKETLFDSARSDDSSWMTQLGVISMSLLYHIAGRHLAAGQPLIIESNFDPELAAARLREFQEQWPFTLVQVICVAGETQLTERFKERAQRGDRHPVHSDDPDVLEMATHFADQDKPLDFPGTVIQVDTSDFNTVDSHAIAEQVRAALLGDGAGVPASTAPDRA